MSKQSEDTRTQLSLTREQITHYLGDIDDLTAARVASTGASVEELRQVLYETRREVEEGEAVAPASNIDAGGVERADVHALAVRVKAR